VPPHLVPQAPIAQYRPEGLRREGAAMKLYGYFRSSAAFRVRIALNLKGIAYEQSIVHLRRAEQDREEYLALNPQALVPTLETDGEVLTQSLAIIEYLDETHPEPPLLPGHPGDRARVRALAQAIACDMHPICNLRVLRYLEEQLGQSAAAVEGWYNHWLKLGFDAVERQLAEDGRAGDFCHGDEPTIADLCLVPQWLNAHRFPSFDRSAYPTISRIFENCLKLDAVQRALPKNQPDAE
jgi:maleylacetoacetate isomerase